MRIAILCHSGTGGSGILATELAFGLSQLGHEVHLVAERVPHRMTDAGPAPAQELYRDLGETPPAKSLWGQLVELVIRSFYGSTNTAVKQPPPKRPHFHELFSFDYPLFDGSSLPTLRSANTLAWLIERYKIDIVNAHYVIPHATSAILARDSGLNVKVVTTLHGTDITKVGPEPAFSYTTRHALHASDAVTSVCSFLATEASRNFGVNRTIDVIPNWVDTRRFARVDTPDKRLQYAQPDELLLLHASNFRPVKRSPAVIDIFARVLKERSARLILVGDGPDRQSCIERAAELGVSGRVITIPPQLSVEELMGVADFLLLPSEIEGLPLVLLEAMAAGAISIASRVGGIPELIADGSDGFLFEVSELDKMAQKIVSLSHNPSEMEAIRKAARDKVISRYTPEVLVPEYVRVFSSLMKENSLLSSEAGPSA